MVDSFLTVKAAADAELEVSRSRFLAHVAPVATEDEARAVIERVRGEHPSARHHCTAFVLGPDARVRRSNDDGEPSGSAGRPMLEVLGGREVSDVVAVVTRYFGGTLLGVGGLVRAYGDATSLALDAAGTRERRLRSLVDVHVPLEFIGQAEHRMRERWNVVSVEYGAEATLRLAVKPDDVPAVAETAAALTSGAARVVEAGETWT